MTAAMPRGGPDASRLDRWYETDRPEYLDRPDTPREAARVRRGLDRLHRLTGGYDRFARWTLAYAGRAPAPGCWSWARAPAGCRGGCCTGTRRRG